MKPYMRIAAHIDLDNIVYNMESMRKNINPKTKIMAVIKTDGYGHGAIQIAHEIEPLDYLFGFAVATVEEAVILRKSGIKKPVLILGYTFPDAYKDIVKYEIRPAVFKEDMAKDLSEEAVRQGKKVYFHIKTDTGMGRIGLPPVEESLRILDEIKNLPNVVMEGIFTHFAKADMKDPGPTEIQIDRFHTFIDLCDAVGIKFQIHHCSNSAGIIAFPQANDDMVRAGITLYGLWPSDEVSKEIVPLKAVMELKSHIVYIKEIDIGTQISYGGTYTAKEKRIVATIPVGYGDGYPRTLSGKGYVLIHGQKAPIIGRICMDQFMVDVTDVKDVKEYDEVILIGKDGDSCITMEELGDLSGRFNYELACDIGKRVPRVFYKGGKIVAAKDYFDDYQYEIINN